MPNIEERLAEVLGRIADAASRSGRSADEITLVAVSKTVTADGTAEAVAAGVRCLGENRVQEAEPKIKRLGGSAEWHLIGHLQSNKSKRAVALFDWIQSVDSLRVLCRLGQHAAEAGVIVPVLLQVNTSQRETQYGVPCGDAIHLARAAADCTSLRVRGLMTIGPMTEVESDLRAAFRVLRETADAIRGEGLPGVSMDTLSMGMTDDFETAIEEGSTMVRIGRAIFGARAGNAVTV